MKAEERQMKQIKMSYIRKDDITCIFLPFDATKIFL